MAIDDSLVEERGPLARDVGRVVEEAVNNAVTHGDATVIDVQVRGAGGALHLEVSDNGAGPAGHDPGLGSALFDSLCVRWELIPISRGTQLTATILRS